MELAELERGDGAMRHLVYSRWGRGKQMHGGGRCSLRSWSGVVGPGAMRHLVYSRGMRGPPLPLQGPGPPERACCSRPTSQGACRGSGRARGLPHPDWVEEHHQGGWVGRWCLGVGGGGGFRGGGVSGSGCKQAGVHVKCQMCHGPWPVMCHLQHPYFPLPPTHFSYNHRTITPCAACSSAHTFLLLSY